VLFTAVLLIVVSSAVWGARQWDIKARLFPWAIGFPLIALLLVLLVQQVMHRVRTGLEEGTPRQAIEEAEEIAAAEAAPACYPAVATPMPDVAPRANFRLSLEQWRFFSIIAWLVGFPAAIWILGFPLGCTLGTLAYLKLSAREKWPISLAVSTGMALFFFLMINGLHTPFPKGGLLELLDIGQDLSLPLFLLLAAATLLTWLPNRLRPATGT
jgi:hypothetical protein